MNNATGAAFMCLAVVALLCASAHAADSSRYPTNESLRHFRAINDPQLSPDGNRVLLRITDAVAEGAKDHLWLINVTGSPPRQLTFSPSEDLRGEDSGIWMPDGQRILFRARRGEHTTLFMLPVDGGEAKPLDIKVRTNVDLSRTKEAVTHVPSDDSDKRPEEISADIDRFDVSPDGKWLAFTARDPESSGEKRLKQAKADAVWIDHDLHGIRLYLLELSTNQVTPVAAPADVNSFAWNRDSSRLIVITTPPNHATDLGPASTAWIVTLADLSHPYALAGLPPTIETAAWSFDDRSIVYLAQAAEDAPPTYCDLYVYDLQKGSSRNLSESLDGTIIDPPIVLPDATIAVIVAKGVEQQVMTYSANGLMANVYRVPMSVVSHVGTNLGRSGWLFLGNSGGRPPQLFFARRMAGPLTRLAAPDVAPANTLSTAPTRIQWNNEGLRIQGLLYLPPQAQTQKVPLIVEAHGGPPSAYADGYDPFVDFLLSQGWAVLRANPRGSSGRGTSFATAIKNDLGGADYRDIMAGVDYVLKAAPIDLTRMAFVGYSYGGELAAFAEVKTDRFMAIVSGSPVIDQYSEYGTEDDSWADRWYFGRPWENAADAWRQSPLSGVISASTPLLLLQGSEDTSDPPGQAREMYRALRQLGVPVDLITYPREDHASLWSGIYVPLWGLDSGSQSREPWHGFDARKRIVAFIESAFNATR